MKLIAVYIFFLTTMIIQNLNSTSLEIKWKIDNEIITNQDIVSEANYLISLNNNLEKISKQEIYNISVQSLIKNKIRYLEVSKFYNFNVKNKKLDSLILSNLLSKFNLSDQNELKELFILKNINYEEIQKKMKVEIFWNQLIFDKYISKVSLNKEKLREDVIKQSNKSFIEEYYLKEILFELNDTEIVENKLKKILKTIENNNFETAASIYGTSDTALQGGEIGWIKKSQLSKKIVKHILELKLGEITKPIQVGNKYLLIKIENKRNSEVKIDVDKELEIVIQKETDRQLNQFSANYFNKIKKNIYINEL